MCYIMNCRGPAIHYSNRGHNRGLPQGWNQWKIGKINKLYNFRQNFDFALYGSWEALDSLKILPQGPPTFSTPGQAIPRLFEKSTFVGLMTGYSIHAWSHDKLPSIVYVFVCLFMCFVVVVVVVVAAAAAAGQRSGCRGDGWVSHA